MHAYDVIETAGKPIKAWTHGVQVAAAARRQLENVARLPFVHGHVAAMPDVHWGRGATVGSVIAMRGAVVPAAVGVDIGCGMMAVRTNLTAARLPDSLTALRADFEAAVPHGRSHNGDPRRDTGAWREVPAEAEAAWAGLSGGFDRVVARQPKLAGGPVREHLGTLGGGNHFVELCLDEEDRVWLMLHSGSRGIGRRIGSHYIALAKREMESWFIDLPDKDLAYFAEGSELFAAYVGAVGWAQRYAEANREVMMARLVDALGRRFAELEADAVAINCHHNYVAREHHFGTDLWVTRKGAVRADLGDLGIIPGSMGARSYIVRGKGNPDSFCSCSHGAGRAMSRDEARQRFSLDDHARATAGVECRKDEAMLDETPMAYKDIEAVMAAQSDLVEVVHTLKQVLCVKG